MKIKNPRTLPYGCFHAGKFSVLFDRRYKPIVLLRGRWPDCDLSRAVRCDPDWWIEHESQQTFYSDGAAPSRDKKTRARLMDLVRSIPGLVKEIERRSGAKVAA